MKTEFTAGLAKETEKGTVSPGATVTAEDTMISTELADFSPEAACTMTVVGSLSVKPSLTINCIT